jgi:hypothetical protein
MSFKKIINIMDKVTTSIEFVIAFSLLVVIVIKLIEIFFTVIGYPVNIVSMDFEKILSAVLTLVIGVEFIKMLCKHTPETVIDVLLFAVARQIVIYQENILDLLVGIVAIVGLFAAKKFLTNKNFNIGKNSNINKNSDT